MYKQPHYKVLVVFFGILMSASLASCTWVKKTPEAEKVRLVPADRVADCTKLGSVTTSTVNKVVVTRSAEKVRTELETLAQIEAATMNADTIVVSSEIIDGRQSFDVYRCLK